MTARKPKSESEIRDIRARRERGEKLSSIGIDYGLSKGAISRICARKAYGWVDAVPAQEETTHVGG